MIFSDKYSEDNDIMIMGCPRPGASTPEEPRKPSGCGACASPSQSLAIRLWIVLLLLLSK